MTEGASCWKLLDERFARLVVGALAANVDVARPNAGLTHACVNDEAFDETAARLLVISAQANPPTWPARLVDRYVRGNDLVATYAGDDSWPYAPQIYWSVEPQAASGAALGAVSVVVSIQTNLLDTHPRVFVGSSMPAEDVLLVRTRDDETIVDAPAEGLLRPDPESSACGIVWRLPGGALSYAEIMPTSDFCQLQTWRIEPAVGFRGLGVRWELFAEFLEKGVIRRARVQSLFLPRDNDVELAAECCRAIDKRPLPLTT